MGFSDLEFFSLFVEGKIQILQLLFHFFKFSKRINLDILVETLSFPRRFPSIDCP